MTQMCVLRKQALSLRAPFNNVKLSCIEVDMCFHFFLPKQLNSVSVGHILRVCVRSVVMHISVRSSKGKSCVFESNNDE